MFFVEELMPEPLCRHYALERVYAYNFIGPKVLDIGCGTGFFTSKFKNSIGLDLSKENVIHAKKLLPEKDFVLANACHLPFKNDIFSSIISFEIIEHLKEQEPLKLFSEILRCLKINGYYILSFEIYTFSINLITPIILSIITKIKTEETQEHKKNILSNEKNCLFVDFNKISHYLPKNFDIVWQQKTRGFLSSILMCISIIVEKITRPKKLVKMNMASQHSRFDSVFIKVYIKFIYPAVRLIVKYDSTKKDTSCCIMLLRKNR